MQFQHGHTCSQVCSKVRYLTEALAAEDAVKLLKKYGQMAPYECVSCGFWHLTSSDTKKPGR